MTDLDRWLTTTPQDKAHAPECNCEPCHDWHVDEGLVRDHAANAPLDFECCVSEFKIWVERGDACKLHPYAYCEPGVGCEECKS